MEELLLLPFVMAAALSKRIYGENASERNWARINIFRAFLFACILFLLTKPILRLLDLHDFSRSWHFPVTLYLSVLGVTVLSLITFVAGEGHHDGYWNHRRGWWAIAFGIAIILAVWGVTYLSLPE